MIDILIQELETKLAGLFTQIERKNDRRLYVSAAAEHITEIARILYRDMGARFSIATGLDTFAGIELLYHFSFDRKGGVFVSVRVLLADKARPSIASLAPLLHAADWIEREIHELLGVEFVGHPNLTHLLLASDWPEGQYPLRKDFVSEKGLPVDE